VIFYFFDPDEGSQRRILGLSFDTFALETTDMEKISETFD
jgi:hypothetical protein